MISARALAFAAALITGAAAALAADDDRRVSRPFEYRGYTTATFTEHRRVSTFIAMSDGTKLAATIFIPVAQRDVRVPVILWYLPGHRESIDPRTGAMRPYGSPEQIKFFTSHGYAWALVEMRGSGASFGTRQDRSPQIGRDGKDIVEWLAAQSWSNGNVGMVGASYQGFSQYATAAHRPKGLKAIFPEIAGFDEYSIMFYPGGIQSIAMSDFATASIAMDDQNVFRPARTAGSAAVADRGAAFDVLPSAPVVDEDGDGELIDEIPIDKNGNGTFLDDGDPTYADGNTREHLYFQATQQHLQNVNLTASLVAKAPFRDSPLGPSQITYAELGPADRLSGLAGSGIAVYNRAGWFDYHARCAAQWFASLQGKTPSRLMFAPTGHSGFAGGRSSGGPYWKHFGLTLTDADLNTEKLRFFDRYLKGIDNGMDRDSPVYIYVMGKGWRAEQEWPLQRARTKRLYFTADHSLAEQPKPGSDAFTSDLKADSRSHGANRWNFRVASASAPLGSVSGGAIRYDSAPLAADMEVTGHPIVQIAVSSSAPDGDFFVYLEDVAPDGSVMRVTDGLLRASFEKTVSEDTIALGAQFDVKPALPWNGFTQANHNAKVFANDRVAKLEIDLMPTSWLFRKGHRIRIAIAGADWPTFRLNPALAPDNDPAAVARAPVYDIHRGTRMSFVDLPVVEN